VIDRIPIPQATPEVIRASKLARAAPAGFWIRFLATVLDSAIALIICAVFGLALNFLPIPQFARYWLWAIVSFALLSAYSVVFWAIQGATPGKKFLGLTIVTAASKTTGGGVGWGTAILRAFGYVVSFALVFLGFLLIAFTSQKQGLHDLIASTRVVRVR